MRTCGTVTTAGVTSGAENVLLNPAPGIDGAVGIVRNAWQSAACDRGSAVIIEGIQYTTLTTSPPFQKDGLCCGVKVRSTDLVGYSHRMISSAFSANGDQIANVDWEVAVPQQLAPAALTPVIEPVAFPADWMAWYEAPYKEVAETLVRDYDGRIHLGKNKRTLFQLERTEGTYGTNVTNCNAAIVSLGLGSHFQNGFASDLGIVFP